MLGAVPAIAFVPSADLDRSRRFYGDILGLAVAEVSPFACAFHASGVMLRVTKVDELRPQPFTVFGWRVADIRPVMAGLWAAGVTFIRYDGIGQDRDGVWTAPGGDQIAWFTDPDGNILSLTQFTIPGSGH